MSALELKIPPVIVLVITAALIWAAGRNWPQFKVAWPGLSAVAWGFTLASFAAWVLGVIALRRAGTTVNPMKPESASLLVASGIYRVTRNPIYLGMLLLLAGWAALVGNFLGFVMLPLFVLYMNRFQIEPEERALARAFGEPFVAYLSSVRRWI